MTPNEKISLHYEAHSKRKKCPICEHEYYRAQSGISYTPNPETKGKGDNIELKFYQIVCAGCGFMMRFSADHIDGN
jgi:transposase-like protein